MEQSFVAWAKMRAHRLPQVKLGIGDDAAVMAAEGARDMVVTTDTLMEGVHFLSQEVDLRRIGAKLVKVNLSDLAAMAARAERFIPFHEYSLWRLTRYRCHRVRNL